MSHSYCVRTNRGLPVALARLANEGDVVTVVGPRRFRGDLRWVEFENDRPEQSTALGDRYESRPINTFFSRWIHLMRYASELRPILRDHQDVVHAWEEPYIWAGHQIASQTPRTAAFVFSTFQNLDKVYPPPFSWFERSVVNRCDGWIAFGKTVEDTMLRRPGYGARPHRVIPPGIDTRFYVRDGKTKTELMRRLDWSLDGSPVIGFLGRFIPEKGLRFLTGVLGSITEPWRVIFVGGGPEEGFLRDWAEGQNGRARVVTGVSHDEVPAYLSTMDILCAPSETTTRWREQFGRMIVEAQSCGVCVLGSDSGEIPHTIGNGGVVLPEGDHAAWRQALLGLLKNPSLRNEIAARGRKRAHETFDWNVVARAHLELFESITAERRGESS